jgi:hypothetical protein
VSLKILFVLWHASRVSFKEANLQSHKPKQYTMNNLKLLLLTGTALAFAGAASAQISTIVEQWTFDTVPTTTGVNGTVVDTWTGTADGILEYAPTGSSTSAAFGGGAVNAATIDSLVLTIDLTDMLINPDGSNDQLSFRIGVTTTAGADSIELELNTFSNGDLAPDLEHTGGSTGDLDVTIGAQGTGTGAMQLVATWNFWNVGTGTEDMSLAWSGALGSGSGSIAAAPLADVLSINSLQVRLTDNGTKGNTFINLDTVTIETVAVPEPSTFALLAGIAGLGLVLYRRRR